MAMGMSSKFGKMDASKDSYKKPNSVKKFGMRGGVASNKAVNDRRSASAAFGARRMRTVAPPAGQDSSMRQARMQAMKKRIAGR
jgi:hypothetical protein